MTDKQISVVVPALEEAGGIKATLECLVPLRARGHEVILADGGSRDGTVDIAGPLVDRAVISTPGRARQMNAGAALARGDVLWFLHADTLVPPEADDTILAVLTGGCRWGRFDVRLSGRAAVFRIIERMMNLRSCLSGIATGDQGMFVERSLFEAAGGFPDQPLMEDIELSRRLKKMAGRPACLKPALTTSSRRWERDGVIATVLLMWRLRLGYFLGVPPARLHARYYGGS